MKFARLLIAAAVLAGLGGLLYWSNRNEAAKASKPDSKAAPKILDLRETDVKKIEIQHHDGETTVLQRDGSGKWSISAPQPLTADQSAVSAFTTAASTLSSDRVVDENASNLASYGLDPPKIGITLTMADGKTHMLRIGEDTPTEGDAYAMLDGGAAVGSDLDVIDGIAPISPSDGSLGATIGLSSTVDIDNSETIFSGAGRIAVLTTQALNIIDPVTGFVDVEPVPSIPRPNACDQSFGNGVLERQNGNDALLFVPDDGRTISRYDVKTGAHEVVIDFPPGDGACAVSVDKADSLFVVAATNNPPLATSDFGAEQIIGCPATLQ